MNIINIHDTLVSGKVSNKRALGSVLNGHIGDCDYIVLFDGLCEEEKCLEISARMCATRTAGLIMMWIGV